MSQKRNAGMFGGAEDKDPNMGEYEAAGNLGTAAGAPEPEKPGLVKIPMDWGRRFAVAYDNGQTVEYGLGKLSVPPAGAKPLYYLMEALE
jgi:hypothetical protein